MGLVGDSVEKSASELIMIDDLLNQAKVIAIVGISNKPERDSYKVAAYLQEQGYRILAINPLQEGNNILGEQCYATLQAACEATHLPIDIVDCFRKAEDIPRIVEEAIAINARAIWMQLEIVNHDAALIAGAAGLKVVMNRCTKIEHKRLHQIS
jgi:predicted CoA-binding protein